MLRITKQADYGIVLLTYFAREEQETTLTASELARRTRLPPPTVTKVLKLMARHGLLISHRGVQGGYQLAHPPEEIRVIDIISGLEGPIAFTQCAANAAGCAREPICPVRPNWQRLDQALREALEGITLAEMAESPAEQQPAEGPLAAPEAVAPLDDQRLHFATQKEGVDADAPREIAASGEC